MFLVEKLAVPISSHLVAELILRKGTTHVDVSSWIEQVVADYLDRTEDDAGWTEHYYELKEEERAEAEELRVLGSPNRGFQWKNLFLPNGSRVRMSYKGKDYYARVEHESLLADGQHLSPSGFVSRVTHGIPRNAWQSLWVRRPHDPEWYLAQQLREGLNRKEK